MRSISSPRIMHFQKTPLILFVAVLAVLLQNVSGALHSQVTSNPTSEQLANQKRSFSIGYVSYWMSFTLQYRKHLFLKICPDMKKVVFPGWEPLDVFGPLEILFQVIVASLRPKLSKIVVIC